MQPDQNDSNCLSIEVIDAMIAKRLIENPALTDQEIADSLGVSRRTVSRRKNGPAVQGKIRDTLAIPEKEIRRLVTKSLACLEAQLDSDDPKMKFAAALALVKLGERFVGNALSIGY